MNKIIINIALFIISILAHSQNNSNIKLDNYLKAYAETYNLNGTILVAKKNDIIYQNAFGYANREWQIKNTIETRFPIASITKQFTAAAILQLEDAGKLSVNDKLSKYFPNYPNGNSVTVHMLLNHTSGIKNFYQNSQLFKNVSVSESPKDSILDLFKKEPFDFSPGTNWGYSNTGYILLGYIIEQVSGQSYEDYVYKNLFQKAGMFDSGIFTQDAIIKNRAYGYTQTNKELITQMVINFNVGYSHGGLYSTVHDLLKWSKALYSNMIISKESLNKMNKPNREDGGAGYGIFLDNIYGRKIAYHTGNIPGYSSVMIRYLNEEMTIIILTNRETNLDFLPKGIASIMFGKEVLTPYPHKEISLKKENLKKFTGKFEGQFPFEVIEKNGKLFMNFGKEVELIPESNTKLFISDSDADVQLEYVFNNKNEIEQVYYIEGGVKTEIKKIKIEI